MTDSDQAGGILMDSGGLTGEGDVPAFRMSRAGDAAVPIVLAVPHAGRAYPPGLLAMLRDPGVAASKLEDRLVDRLALSAARETGAALLVADAPRAMIDLNRSPDDVDWGMIDGERPLKRTRAANRRARSGLGLVPRRLSSSGELWRATLPRTELDRRIAHVHRPYHDQLARMLEEIRDRFGVALLVDVHSMPPLVRSHHGEPVTEYVLGDRFGASCDGRFVEAALDYFERRGRIAVRNRPYAGGYILDRHASPRRSIHGIQLEICRSAYLDARLSEPGARSQAVAKLLGGLVRTLADNLLDQQGYGFPQAAE